MKIKMLDSIINKLKKKNKRALLENLFSLLALIHYPLNTAHSREALNVMGAVRFSRKYSYLKKADDFQRQLSAFSPENTLMPATAKKVAICLSGDTRSFKHCIPQLKRFLSGYDITFFCHGWQSDFKEDHIKDLQNVYTYIEERPDFTNLERSSIKAFGFKIFGKTLKVPFMSPNIFPMWHGVKKAFESIEKNGFDANEFDLICRCRYDNFFLGKLAQLNELPTPEEIIIDPNYDGYGGYGDQFAIGLPDTMRKYCSLFDWLPLSFEQYAGNDRFFPEVIVRRYLEDECGLKVRKIDFGLRLLRNEFVGLEGYKIPLRSHSVSQNRNLHLSKHIQEKFPDLYNSID